MIIEDQTWTVLMRGAPLVALIALGACAQNDRELVNRISVDGALRDTRVAVTNFSQGLLASDQFLGIRLCTIRINLVLSANATRDGQAGLSVSVPASGGTVGANASGSSSATDQRGNTIDLIYRSGNIQTCPPGEAAAAKPAEAPPSQNGNRGDGGTRDSAPPRDPLADTCYDLSFRQANPKRADETQTAWLRRICSTLGVNAMLPAEG